MMNNQLKFVVLKMQQFCLSYQIKIDHILHYILSDFSKFIVHKKVSIRPTENSDDHNGGYSLACEELLHFLYLNNSYLMLSEREIETFVEFAVKNFEGHQFNSVKVQALSQWIRDQTQEVPLNKYKDILSQQLRSQIQQNMIPFPATKKLEEVVLDDILQVQGKKQESKQTINQHLNKFVRSLKPVQKVETIQ